MSQTKEDVIYKMSCVQLQEELRARCQPVSGVKDTLIQRLKECWDIPKLSRMTKDELCELIHSTGRLAKKSSLKEDLIIEAYEAYKRKEAVRQKAQAKQQYQQSSTTSKTRTLFIVRT